MRLVTYILTLAILAIGLNLFAQTDTVQYGKLEVKVIDAKTKKPIEYAVVTIENDSFKKSHFTDSNGLFMLDKVTFGIYNIDSSFTGYSKMKLQNVCINKDSITYLKFEMIYSEIKMGCYFGPTKPLIKPNEPTQQNFNNKQIMRMPF
jgi:hypothetical protein